MIRTSRDARTRALKSAPRSTGQFVLSYKTVRPRPMPTVVPLAAMSVLSVTAQRNVPESNTLQNQTRTIVREARRLYPLISIGYDTLRSDDTLFGRIGMLDSERHSL